MQPKDGVKLTRANDNFVFWNCASGVFNKKIFIEKYIAMLKPEAFFVSECDVKQSHMLERLNIKGYTIEVANTINEFNKGRLLAYVRDGSDLTRVKSLENSKNDIIVLKSKTKLVVGIYSGFLTREGETMASNFERLLDNLKTISDKCTSGLIIAGDFNADLRKDTPKRRQLEIWQTNCGVDQLVTENTRERLVMDNVQSSLIDHVYVREISVKVSQIHSEVSDHNVIVCNIAKPTVTKIMFKKKTIIDWRNYSDALMSEAIGRRLSEIEQSRCPERFNCELTIAISMAMNECIPKRTVHLRRDTDIVNYQVEALKKKRDRQLKKARKTGAAGDRVKVKELDASIKRVLKKEKERLLRNKMKSSSPTTFWSVVNGLLGKGAPSDVYPLKMANEEVMPDDDIAQAFADFFKNKVDALAARNPIVDEPVDFSYVRIEPFSENEIRKAISTFKPKKSTSPDEIPMLVVKNCIDVLIAPIQHLFSLITEVGRIPKVWKTARLKPIFKKGDKTSIENYRPISNLNSISKLLERCVLNRVDCGNKDIDGINQHGFRSHHSTTTAALEVQDQIAMALDDKKKCIVYSMDLSAAFDLVRPGIFARKARNIIKDDGLTWLIYDYITERKAYVEVGSSTSMIFNLDLGCPQGSTLGPKVFNLYCSDLINEINDGVLVSYADDSYVVMHSKDLEDLKERVSVQIDKHLLWLKHSGMVCNENKTELIVFGEENATVTIRVGSKYIESMPQMKVLGLLFDKNLAWDAQIESVIKRTNRIMHGLKGVRKYVDVSQAKQIVTAFYFSVLFYGCEVWLHKHLSFHLKQKVRSAHYRALRLIYGQQLTRDELDDVSQRSTPDEWSDYSIAKMVSTMVITGAPSRLRQSVMENSYAEGRKEGQLFFYDTSQRKIGRQRLKNRLTVVCRQMKFEWMNSMIESLRPKLKTCFFKYAMIKKD